MDVEIPTFEETWEVFEFYWNYLTEHPGCTYEEAERARKALITE